MDMCFLSVKTAGLRKKFFVLIALMLAVVAEVRAGTSDTNMLYIDVTFTQPSCSITVPPSYDLGSLTGTEEKAHGDLIIKWSCAGDGNTPVKTALTATIVKGLVEDDGEKVRLVMADGQVTGASLSLREKAAGSFIKLNSNSDYFCSDASEVAGNQERICTLTPVTRVSGRGPFGLASAVLRFRVVYP